MRKACNPVKLYHAYHATFFWPQTKPHDAPHCWSSRRSVRDNGHGHAERQESSNTQRLTQNKRSPDSPSNPPVKNHKALATQKDDQFNQHSRSLSETRRIASESTYSRPASGQLRQSIGPFQPFRSRYSESPSRYIYRSMPLYPSSSHIIRPLAPYQLASEPSFTYSSVTRQLSSHVQSQLRVDPSIPSTCLDHSMHTFHAYIPCIPFLCYFFCQP